MITWHDKKIFISGDTENSETIATVKGIDWAFVPVWLLTDATEKDIKLSNNIKMVAIYHIGPGDKITAKDPVLHLLDNQGEIIKISY